MTAARALDDILPLLGDEVVVLHAPYEIGDVSASGGTDVDVAVRNLDPYWPLRLPANARLLNRMRYDATGTSWFLKVDDRNLEIDTLEDPRGRGRYKFPTEPMEDTPEYRAAYLAHKRTIKGSGASFAVRVRGFFSDLPRALERLRKPTGIYVLVVGPDGTGKSTVADALAAGSFPLRKIAHGHWRPGLLPGGSDITGKCSDPTRPHAQAPRSGLTSLAVLVYRWIDFALGGFGIWVKKRRGVGTILERGWWDMAVDPRRYRLKVAPGVVMALGKLLPKPDVILVLHADAAVLAARSNELPPDETARQTEMWARTANRIGTAVDVDTGAAPPEVNGMVGDIIESTFVHRARRFTGSAWAELASGRTKVWIPRSPGRVSRAGLRIYEPNRRRARMVWSSLGVLARFGLLRTTRRSAPPEGVVEAVGPLLESGETIAVARANHPGRYSVLALRPDGTPRAFFKVALSEDGRVALRTEAGAIDAFAAKLPSLVAAPHVSARTEAVTAFDAYTWTPRPDSWRLGTELAAAIGTFNASGARHGDFAPWNLGRTARGWVLFDWEEARPATADYYDLWHYVIQAHALLERPTRQEIVTGLEGSGEVGAWVQAYAEAADVSIEDARPMLLRYLEDSLASLDRSTEDGSRGARARDALLEVLSR